MGNEARFINDYRGIANKPNALFKEIRTGRNEDERLEWQRNNSKG